MAGLGLEACFIAVLSGSFDPISEPCVLLVMGRLANNNNKGMRRYSSARHSEVMTVAIYPLRLRRSEP